MKTVKNKHNAKNCSGRGSCIVSNGKHVAALHDYLRKKTAIQSEKCLTDAKKNQGGVKWA